MTQPTIHHRTEGPMFRRVRFRLTLFTALLVMSLYTVSSFAFYGIVHRVVVNSMNNRLLQEVKSGAVKRALKGGKPIPNAYFWVQVGGRTVQDMPPVLVTYVTNKVESNPPTAKRQFTWTYHGTPYQILIAPIRTLTGNTRARGYFAAARNVRDEMEVLDHVKQVLLDVGAGGLVLAALIGFALAERSLRPIRQAWQKQSEFAADASHELRTPLAVIQSNLSLVLAHPDETVLENFEWLNAAQSELRRLSRLVTDLLTLSRAGADTVQLKQDPVDLAAVLTKAVALFEGVVEQKQLALHVAISDQLIVQGDAERLYQLAVILIDNAIKYTSARGSVTIAARQARSQISFEVSDTGCGINEVDLPRIFQRFYRSTEARRQSSEGFGLGLSMAHWIVEAHRGKITAASQPGIGTKFTVWLPAKRGASSTNH